MLRRLEIKNYALITDLTLELGDGLTIVTGETGAGKSIMMGALSLLLGERADTRVISDGSRKSLVEATFAGVDESLRQEFEANDLEWTGGEIIIRREISSAGRSRAFVNDSPVTLPVLSLISRRLVDIHSQHSNARLSSQEHQLEIIDSIADNESLLNDYRKEFREFVALRGKVKTLKDKIAKARENEEFLRFQKDQLDKLAPKEGELRQIEQQYDMLSDADEIRENLADTIREFRAGDTGIIDRLSEVRSLLDKINLSYFDPEGDNDIARRTEEVMVEIKDIADTLEDYVSSVDSDPMLLSKVSARMNAYYDAMKRFRVAEADDLVALRKDISAQLSSISGGDGQLAELEKEGKKKAKTLKSKADDLSASRREAAEKFAVLLNETARPLGLHNMRFLVDISEGKLTADGQDRIEFLCSFNKNQSPLPVSKVASGGEISRLMLAMKRILADKMKMPTVIFDEIDTGVSGEIADKMGDMMRDMSGNMQVLTITHLPQVAAKGKSHLKVYKKDDAERTVTHIRHLSEEERVREIAGMLSGSEVNEAAVENARTLLRKN